MMADSLHGEGSESSDDGGSGAKQECPSVIRIAWAAFTHCFHRAQGRDREAGYDQPPAAYTHARALYTHARAYGYVLTYANVQAYCSLAVKASGLLALLLSTVILLGGYVQSLVKEDFFCIITITVIQAVGIFQDWETNVQYLSDFSEILLFHVNKLDLKMATSFSFKGSLITHISVLVLLPFMVLILCVQLFYLLGPLACAGISSWRLAKLNHGNHRDGTDSMADMMAALNIFYSLIIFQGAMFLVLLLPMYIYAANVVRRLQSLEQLSEKWGMHAIVRYILYISAKCRKDPLSIRGLDLIKYGAELLDSESQEDYLYGARLLNAFIRKGKDVSWVLLSSRQKIQKLIDSLSISSSLGENTEIRELAATIVADLAGHIDVARYPGALRYISSLLQEETAETYWNSSKQVSDPQPPPRPRPPWETQSREERMQNLIRSEEGQQWRLMRDQKRLGISQERRRQKSQGGTSKELILQGLTILERLASNSDDNRRIICGAPRLLPKITAPVYSVTLIEDVKTKAWADIVTRCLKVLYQLIHSPGRPSRRLRRQIFSNAQALSNLKSILLDQQGNDDEADYQELQLVAMEILTELSLDLSINLTDEVKKVLITKQLQLFLLANGDDEEESAAIAGRTMVSLSTNSESNSALIMTTENGIIGCLTEILDDKKNITQRTIAAEIMANLCAHGNVDNMKEKLTKVLRKIMYKIKSQQRKASAGQKNPALGDEENQGNSVSTNNEERHSTSTQGNDIEIEEIFCQEREEQEAFLSLAQVICNKLNSADLDGAILEAVDENNVIKKEKQRELFVDKLKTIIDDNHHPTADSLRIVKLCGQIAKSVMRCEQYVEIFRNKGFKSSLSEASKTMSELESCMLFVGTDFGLKKTVRPLFSEIEKTWSEM